MASAIAGWRIEILATMSQALCWIARQGRYSQFEVQRGLPIKLLVKHFTRVDEQWQIAPEVRAMVKYPRFNLLADFETLGTFRRYFNQDTESDVLRRLAEALSSDGYLVLGAAETAIGLCDRFKMVSDQPGLYTLNTISPRLLAQPRTTHARPRLIAISGGR